MRTNRLIRWMGCVALLAGAMTIEPASHGQTPEAPLSPAGHEQANIAVLIGSDSKPLAAVARIGSDLLLATVQRDRTALEKDSSITIVRSVATSNSGDKPQSKGSNATREAVPLPVIVAASNEDGDSGLILLRAAPDKLDALGLKRVAISSQGPSFAAPLELALPGRQSDEAALEDASRFGIWARDRIRITGLAGEAGGVVFNSCGEVIGLTTSRDTSARGSLTMISSTALLDYVRQEDAAFKPADALCDSGEADGLDNILAKTRADISRLRQQLTGNQEKLGLLGQQLQAPGLAAAQRARLSTEAEQLKASITEINGGIKAAEDLVAAIERYRSAHSRDRLLTILALALVIAALASMVYLIIRTRRNIAGRDESTVIFKAKTSDAQKRLAAKPWQDVVLSGDSGVLKIKGNLLGEGLPGAVLGRSPSPQRAQINFGPADISNVHARFFVSDGQLKVEDLDSTHGTFVDGRRLEKNQPVGLRDGATIRLANHSFQVRIR